MSWTDAIGSVLPSIVGYFSQQSTNKSNKELARDQSQFQIDASSNAYVRAAKDLKAAGINPILAGQFGGASSPAGALATMMNPMQGALTGASTAKTIKEGKLTDHKSAIAKAEAILKNNLIPASELASKTAQAALDLISSATSDMDIKGSVKIIQDLAYKAGGDAFTWYNTVKKSAASLPKEQAAKAITILTQAIKGMKAIPQKVNQQIRKRFK